LVYPLGRFAAGALSWLMIECIWY